MYLDGSAAAGSFPLSNAPTVVPGKEVEILAGPGNKPVSIFKGVVVRQSLKVREQSAPQLIVECRHKASRLTVGRKNAYFIDQTDAEIIDALLGGAGITGDVEPTEPRHPQQVQYRATDWDFLVTRAEANGRLVLTNSDTLAIKAPRFDATPAANLLFGATILELDAEIDARLQVAAVKAVTWDPAQQSTVEREARDPRVTGPGNLTTADLAAVAALDAYELRHTAVAEDEAQAWADAAWLKSQMSRVSGRAKCEGIAGLNPGDIATISGVGDRYSGNVFVTGIRHDFDTVQGWKTHVQFGRVDELFADEPSISSPLASALLPGVHGLQIGVVTSNEDPDGEHRIRVRIPVVDAADDGAWARVASVDAGADRGVFILPEIDDEVVVGFLDGDPRRPVVLGMLYSSAKPAPLQGSDDNHEKVYQTRSRMKLYFNDDTKVLQLETPAGNTITLSEDEKAIHVKDQNGSSIDMTSDGIAITSSAAITMKAATNLTLEAGASLEVTGSSAIKLSGAASVEVASSGTTTISGSLVRIN